MGQITNPAAPGINVLPTDRETGPGAGPGNSGDNTIFLGLGSGTNNTQPNVIALGNAAFSAGVTGNSYGGSIVLGVNAAKTIVGDSAVNPGPLTVIGYNALQSARSMGNSVVIGDNAAATVDSATNTEYNNVIVGSKALELSQGNIADSVVIGYRAARQGAGGYFLGSGNLDSSVVIGSQALSGVNQQGMSDWVCIGKSAAASASNAGGNNVAIGSDVAQFMSTFSDSVLVGNGIFSNTGGSTQRYNTIMGTNAQCFGEYNTIIGYQAANTNNYTGSRNIFLGAGGGRAVFTTFSDIFTVSTYDFLTSRYLLYGEIGNGNLYLGNVGTGFDLASAGGNNCLKIFNGTKATGSPSNGGFFYVSGGALHYVGSSGTDTTIAPA